MNNEPKVSNGSAFTRIELSAVIALLALLAVSVIPPLAESRQISKVKQCVQNLKQIGIAYKTWSVDCSDAYPMARSTNFYGTREFVLEGRLFLHFQAMSNELATPKVLICPSDTRMAVTNFTNLQNENLSYFVGLDAADVFPEMFLAGDRNIESSKPPVHSILDLSSPASVRWTKAIHKDQGNIGLADGSVQLFSNLGLQHAVQASTNRIALPE